MRVKDVDLERGQIVVREGKGEKDRVVPLPKSTLSRLREQIARVARIHAADVSTTQIYTHVLQRGACGVVSPLDRL